MEKSLIMEEHNKLFEEEEMRFAQLQDEYVKIEVFLKASNQYKQLLHKHTCLGDLRRSMLEINIRLKERVEQTKVTTKQCEKRQAKKIPTNTMLEKAIASNIDDLVH
ncbi:hypothetical protein CR513_59704, partial [Mucuna pruriens]